MIDYELAKRLKDAGFSYKNNAGYVTAIDEKGNIWNAFKFEGSEVGIVIVPTLSEIIEACGESFDSLIHRNTGELVIKDRHNQEVIRGKDWVARYKDIKINEIIEKFGWGDTPEEAVANLWLVLQGNEKEI